MSISINYMETRDDAYLPRDPLSRIKIQHFTVGESKTRQSEADQSDVNKIVERFSRTGYLPPMTSQPIYDDVTGIQGDFTDKINESLATREIYQNEQNALAAAQAAAAAAPVPAPAAPTPPAPAV